MKKSDDALITLLAAGTTVTAAAERSGLSQRTIRRRLSDAGFRAQVAALRAEILASAAGQLTNTAVSAVNTLKDLLEPAQPPSVRLGAARAILQAAVDLQQAAELEQRLRALEEHVRGRKHVRPPAKT